MKSEGLSEVSAAVPFLGFAGQAAYRRSAPIAMNSEIARNRICTRPRYR